MKAIVAVLTLTCLLATPVWAETLYKWVDADGVTHFTREPPENIEYEEITTAAGRLGKRSPSPPPSGDVDPGAESTPTTLPQDRADEEEPDPDDLAGQCERARENVYWLTESDRVEVQDQSSGETRWVSGEDRIQLRDETQTFIDENCPPS